MSLSGFRNAPSRDLRIFSGLQFVFFGVVCFVLGRDTLSTGAAVGILTVSAIVAVVGLVSPSVIRPVYLAWMTLVFPLGWLVSHLVMAVVYFLVITPIGAYRRSRFGDPLQRKADSRAASYWESRPTHRPPETYFRQF